MMDDYRHLKISAKWAAQFPRDTNMLLNINLKNKQKSGMKRYLNKRIKN